MATARRPVVLERTAGNEGVDGNVQRALDQVRADMDDDAVTATLYSASTPADWSGDPPATIAEALDRIAAAVGPVP